MIKVRKRVTLMVVTVSIIFSICWLTDAVIFLLSYHSTTNSPSDVTWSIAAVMILFNSSVNPFVYGLINQRFREKIKGMICCTFRSSNEIHATGEAPLNNQPANCTTQPTKMEESSNVKRLINFNREKSDSTTLDKNYFSHLEDTSL